LCPRHEVEARISQEPWKNYRPVQPLQLTGARQRLISEGLIVNDLTKQTPPVSTIRLADFPEGRKRELERLCGSRRKLYRKYLSWTREEAVCGRVGERVMFNTLTATAPRAALFVPNQTPGRINEVGSGLRTDRTLDGLAYVMEGAPPASAAAMLIEVRNVQLKARVRAGTTAQRLARRARLILGTAAGLGSRRLAQQERMSRTTVRRWVARFVVHRCAGLPDRPRRGRPTCIRPATRALTVALACERPAERNVPL
jgi:hypothetical protein